MMNIPRSFGRVLKLSALFFLCLISTSYAELKFPALTGRVVDEAGMLSSTSRSDLDGRLASLEQQTSNQLVVVTLKSLHGTTIEDYGYQLGRHWGIGQKDKDNGVLLIVAPHERKTRIEVGYGLEGTLTDAKASQIIQGIILPAFRDGHMEQGIVSGAQAIIRTLAPINGDATPTEMKNKLAEDQSLTRIVFIIFFVVFILFARAFNNTCGRYVNSRGSSFGGWSSGLGSGGGFSGGGGSFGGGGASGGW